MGQAKRRGTFEQRLAQALARKASEEQAARVEHAKAIERHNEQIAFRRRTMNSPLLVTALLAAATRLDK